MITALHRPLHYSYWLEIEKDWEQAWEKYKMFVQRGGTDTFLGLVAGVGLASPVEDGCIREIAGHASEMAEGTQAVENA